MEDSIERRIYSAGKTFLCFIVFLICIQPLLLCYLVVSVSRLLWRNFLIVKNQHLTFVKKDNLRTFSYTSRNPGIVNIILHLQGEPNVDAIRNTVNYTVLERKTKTGDLMFPKLSAKLVTCWGFYAWKMSPEVFDVDNHIVVHSPNYRGRSITESNVQNYISNIISKYLPSNIPPFQISIIPIFGQAPSTGTRSDEMASTSSYDSDVEAEQQQQQSANDSLSKTTITEHYIVVRMHHLLQSEESNLRLSDLLAIESTATTSVLNSRGELDIDRQLQKSPLTNIISYPVYIPQLWNRIQISLTNCWNEFKLKYDPYVGKPSFSNSSTTTTTTTNTTGASTHHHLDDSPLGNGSKSPAIELLPIETLTQLVATFLISYFTIASDFYKGFNATKHQPMIKLKFLNSLINREVRKRNISWEVFFNAMRTTMNPLKATKRAFEWICWAGVTISILSPHLLYRELQAFRCCFFQGHAGYPDTLIGFLFAYIPLCYNAFKEFLHLVVVFIQAPRFIYEELIQMHRSDEHILQNISLCGRKVLSWSRKISVSDVRRACIKLSVSPTELFMCATSSTIMNLLHEFPSVPVPKQIRVFATKYQHDFLQGKLNNDDNESAGHLSLILPMGHEINDYPRKQLKQIRQNFKTARENQVGMYFLFLLHKKFNVLCFILPAMWTVIIFNYLSRRFSVTVTEITKNSNSFNQKGHITCFGRPVLDALFFSPPQSNGSVSLSIQQFADHIQLGVITDAQIHPLHVKLSEGWTKNLKKLF